MDSLLYIYIDNFFERRSEEVARTDGSFGSQRPLRSQKGLCTYCANTANDYSETRSTSICYIIVDIFTHEYDVGCYQPTVLPNQFDTSAM